MVTDFERLLRALAEHDVTFVIIGGVALVLHGSARVTQDLDICYARDDENLRKLSLALTPFSPTLRGAPPELPFRLDPPTLKAGLNFTLQTAAGDVDLLGEVSGVGGFAEIATTADAQTVYGVRVLVMGLEALERAKRAAGRLKDLADLAELRILRARRGPTNE
jgi:hypothetical protein